MSFIFGGSLLFLKNQHISPNLALFQQLDITVEIRFTEICEKNASMEYEFFEKD